MSKELRPKTTSGNNFTKKLKIFAENIADENLSHDGEFVEFDNKYIYLSLLEFDVVSEIKNRINDSKCVTSVYKYGLIELAILLLEFMSFTVDKKYCN